MAECLSLNYNRDYGNCHKDLWVKRASHSYVVDKAILFWRIALPRSDVLRWIQYGGFGAIKIVHSWWTSKMRSISRLSRQQGVVSHHTERVEQQTLLRPKQKNNCWMKDGLQRFFTAENVAVDLCSKKFSTLKQCMLLPQPQDFIGGV